MIWDEAKRQANIAKHGIDFADATRFDWDTALFGESQFVDFEQRELVIGLIDQVLCTMVYTETDEAIRIISLRRATRLEAFWWQQDN